MNVRVENWLGHEIRFVEKEENEWWAVAKDVAIALGYKIAPHMIRMVDEDEKDTIRLVDRNKGRGNPNVTIISETGIYEAVFNSGREEAKGFKKWVKSTIKQFRQSSGLEGFQIFRMLDKEHQREMMGKLSRSLETPGKPDFIKANTIANKAVSNKFGHPKMLKKEQMTPQMIVERQTILDDTVTLMAVVDQFDLEISVSEKVYSRYTH